MNTKKPLQGSFFLLIIMLLPLLGCKNNNEKKSVRIEDEISFTPTESKPENIETPKGMVWVPGRTFMQGAITDDPYAMPRERPAHPVVVDGFFIDATEVTNAAFSKFVNATNYITIAERPIDWEVMKKELPAGTPKPHDSILQPGSLVFNKEVRGVVGMENYGQWWAWKIGANWKQPYGPGSSIKGQDNYPVIHIAYEDALAYCNWANRRLPTEAEWELAAQGANNHETYTWGNDASQLEDRANTWTGKFPTENTGEDGFEYIAPTKSFAPNSLGIYDMLGNVWEWTSDVYNQNYYASLDNNKPTINPQGALEYYNPQNPYQIEMVMKGGSYLCHDSYCASFRISARMSTSKDSGSDHLGFRTVATVNMLEGN
ncbi:formylglycine-generating enzyme family protein [Dokdonia sinensis]|uniref:Formylglycine-generating enzyme family protein n=1 Tax=Dokdonia sinensis TaxID=2479847 RepID=A0A3M0GGV0_9FLAO|nr:formylglycine-generating enzyme family protein [Dokdonia sinensis]RMB64165.1 formylglycine-generating enzyme family protein [Dokdonia sinensis]